MLVRGVRARGGVVPCLAASLALPHVRACAGKLLPDAYCVVRYGCATIGVWHGPRAPPPSTRAAARHSGASPPDARAVTNWPQERPVTQPWRKREATTRMCREIAAHFAAPAVAAMRARVHVRRLVTDAYQAPTGLWQAPRGTRRQGRNSRRERTDHTCTPGRGRSRGRAYVTCASGVPMRRDVPALRAAVYTRADRVSRPYGATVTLDGRGLPGCIDAR